MQYKIDFNLCFHPKRLMGQEIALTDEHMKKEGILPFIDKAIEECKKDGKRNNNFDEQFRIDTARKLRLEIIEKQGDEIRKQVCDSCDDSHRCNFYQDYINSLKTQ